MKDYKKLPDLDPQILALREIDEEIKAISKAALLLEEQYKQLLQELLNLETTRLALEYHLE